jgi:hypothetical protein
MWDENNYMHLFKPFSIPLINDSTKKKTTSFQTTMKAKGQS